MTLVSDPLILTDLGASCRLLRAFFILYFLSLGPFLLNDGSEFLQLAIDSSTFYVIPAGPAFDRGRHRVELVGDGLFVGIRIDKLIG